MRVLIFGGRDFRDPDVLYPVMQGLHDKLGFECVIEGEAPGADQLARCWAMFNGLPVEPYFASWDRFGDRAGTIRNARMLREGKPDLAVAFPGGAGTADMIKRINDAGLPLIVGRWTQGPGSRIVWKQERLHTLKTHGNSHT